jgi:toxin FitB
MTRYLLDTCAVSDANNPDGDERLAAWLSATSIGTLYLSIVTIVEITSGIEALPPGKRRDAFHAWLHGDVLVQFAGRVLTADENLVPVWARVRVDAQRHGNNARDEHDFLIAATAINYDMTLVTRNEKDFTGTGVRIHNPWQRKRS